MRAQVRAFAHRVMLPNYPGATASKTHVDDSVCRISRRRTLSLGLGYLGLAGMIGGASSACFSCSAQLIPNTDVDDTDDNRRVIEFCEMYRKAVERGDVAKLLSFADERYYEDGGNVDSSDDIDRAGLSAYLAERFRDVSAIRYEIRYRQVTRGRDNRVFVDYTYSASYQMPSDDGDGWKRAVAENRLELRPKQESFTILSGM